jgi:hypothetical protein
VKTRRLAWNGIALAVPWNWDISNYRFPGRGVAHIDIEDEYSRRLEVDWLADAQPSGTARFLSEYDRSAANLARNADRKTALTGFPEGWQATRYDFRETLPTHRQARGLGVVAHSLLSAVFTARDASFVCRLHLHVLPGDPEEPEAVLRLVTASLKRYAAGPIPWTLFDIDFELPREFVLEATAFEVGSKLLMFRWGGRRLYLWFLSCADRFLTSATREEVWVTGFLNARRQVPGIVFWPGAEGAVTWRRRRRHLFCHRDELSRWCFQYEAGYRRDLARNQLRIWVFNYRQDEDRRMLPALVPGATCLS